MYLRHGQNMIGKRTRTYRIWSNMIDRCRNGGQYHGARGIKVCPQWEDFTIFFRDMGHPPTNNHSLDRINNNGNYEPSNCRWATQQEQMNNTRVNRYVTYKDETKLIVEWAGILGIKYATLQSRLSKGWSVKRAFNQRVANVS